MTVSQTNVSQTEMSHSHFWMQQLNSKSPEAGAKGPGLTLLPTYKAKITASEEFHTKQTVPVIFFFKDKLKKLMVGLSFELYY